MKKVTVIGAGFAGLTVSLKLAQKGFQVDLFESSTRVGGLLRTEVTEHGLIEGAANALLRTEKTEDLFHELNLNASFPLKASRKRFLFREKPRRWPLSFAETLCFVGKFLPKLIFAKKNLKPLSLETLQMWGERHLGVAPTRFILGPAMQGIYGNDISGLSASLILKSLFKPKENASKKKYTGLLAASGGMQEIVNALELKLKELGVRIHLNSAVSIKDLEGPVVVATSARAAAKIVKDRSDNLSGILERIPMSSLMSVTLFFKNHQTTYKGFGCLIPRGYGFKSLGILMNSYIFEGRNKTYNETWILGGIKEQALLDLTDEEVLKLIAAERFQILALKDTLVDYRIHRWKEALPYYNLEMEKALDELKERPSLTGLYLHGNYLSGIGLSKILERSDRIAQEIESYGG